MTLSKAVTKDYYSEVEAAQALGIPVARLHYLLDRHVFNQGSRRPLNIEFTGSDLLLLSYWNKEESAETKPAESRNNVISIEGRKPIS